MLKPKMNLPSLKPVPRGTCRLDFVCLDPTHYWSPWQVLQIILLYKIFEKDETLFFFTLVQNCPIFDDQYLGLYCSHSKVTHTPGNLLLSSKTSILKLIWSETRNVTKSAIFRRYYCREQSTATYKLSNINKGLEDDCVSTKRIINVQFWSYFDVKRNV